VAVCVWLAIVELLLLRWIGNRTTDWVRFALIFVFLANIPLLLHVIYRTWAAFTLEYWVDRNAITVRWADVRQTIPLASLQQVITGSDKPATTSWLDWPAIFLRLGQPGRGSLSSLASLPATDCLVLDAGEAAFAVSPHANDEFIDAIQERLAKGPVANVALRCERGIDPARVVNADRVGLALIALGLVGGVVLFGALMIRYPGLPDVLPFRYSAQGIPLQVREKQALFLIPAIGILAWAVNSVWGTVMAARNQKPGAYLLWGGTIVVQICAFLALAGLIGRR
jgi:hypothetical protein